MRINLRFIGALLVGLVVIFGSSGTGSAGTPSQEWVALFNGNSNGPDEVLSMAVDSSGNTYVTGRSCQVVDPALTCTSMPNHYDIVTIKYAFDGNAVWIRQYGGAANYHDEPAGIAVDGSGNVYMAGTSCSKVPDLSTCERDFVVIKYDPSGEEAWVVRYNGASKTDYTATALQLDAAGNVYLAGTACDASGFSNCPLSQYALAIAKLDPTGAMVWIQEHRVRFIVEQGGPSLAVAADGSLYLAAAACITSCNGVNAVIKYDPQGVFQWFHEIKGSGNFTRPKVLVAPDGSVYTAGGPLAGSFLSARYSAGGTLLWSRTLTPGFGNFFSDAAVDASGNLYVTGSADCHGLGCYYATVKYDPEGAPLWSAESLKEEINMPSAIVLDGEGNAYVMGKNKPFFANSAERLATVKYDAGGQEVWTFFSEGPIGPADQGIRLDFDGNLMISGHRCRHVDLTSCDNFDFITIKVLQPPPDRTPPVTLPLQSPAPNIAGWNQTDLQVALTAQDETDGSGIKEIHYRIDGGEEIVITGTSVQIPLVTEGTHMIYYYAVDQADNREPEQSLQVQIDKTAPELALPALADTYPLGSEVPLLFSASDALSGPPEVSATLDGTAIAAGNIRLEQPGNHELVVTATDLAGNTASRTLSFSVSVGYRFSGFLPPLKADGKNRFQLKQVIPVKFKLTDDKGAPVGNVVAHLMLQKYNGNSPVGIPIEATSAGSANLGNLFRFSGDQYLYNLNTGPLSVGTWELRAVLEDGSVHAIKISLRTNGNQDDDDDVDGWGKPVCRKWKAYTAPAMKGWPWHPGSHSKYRW